jgi:Family of unknown function (DUF6167)
MKRLFYVAVGAGVGVAAFRRASRAARKLTPAGLAGSAGGAVSGLRGSIRNFVDDVRVGMVEREAQLHEALASEAPPPFTPLTGRAAPQTGRSAPHTGRSANGRSAS